jgi:hypothetical protein
LNVPAAEGVPLMVTLFEPKLAVTPVGKPLELTPVAPVVL